MREQAIEETHRTHYLPHSLAKSIGINVLEIACDSPYTCFPGKNAFPRRSRGRITPARSCYSYRVLAHTHIVINIVYIPLAFFSPWCIILLPRRRASREVAAS